MLVKHLDRAGASLGTIEAIHEAVCRSAGGRVLAKAEGEEHRLHAREVDGSVFRLAVDGRDRRGQKRESGAHLRDVRLILRWHLRR